MAVITKEVSTAAERVATTRTEELTGPAAITLARYGAGAYGAGAYGAGAYGGAISNSGYYSALPSDEGVSQVVVPQTYVPPVTGPVIIGGYPEGSGAVGGWGGNRLGAGNGIDGDGFRGGADSFRGGGGFGGRGH